VNVNLEVLNGRKKGQIQTFTQNKIAICRGGGGDLQIHSSEEKVVSNPHGEICEDNEKFYYTDQYSRNGTLLNGKKVIPGTRVQLKAGDILEFAPGGPRVLFTFDSDKEIPKGFFRCTGCYDVVPNREQSTHKCPGR